MNEFDLRRTPARPDLAAAHLKGKVSAEAYVGGRPAQVISQSTALRRAPHHGGNLDTELLHGERFVVYDEREGWAWGQSELDDYVGYVAADDLGPQSADASHRVTQLLTHVYPVADSKIPPLATLSLNAKVQVAGAGDPFNEIKFGPSRGFVFADHVWPAGNFADDFVAVAEAFLGAPYLWGGKQSVGLDCSGLVQIALERAGIAAPRDADMQEAELGDFLPGAIDLAALRRGDLVFWKGHVGIMVDATRMIHANVSAMAVTIDSVADFAADVHSIAGQITSLKRVN